MFWGRKGLHRPVMGYLYRLLRFTCVIINLGTILVHLITAAIRTRGGGNLGAFKVTLLRISGITGQKGTFTLLLVSRECYVMP